MQHCNLTQKRFKKKKNILRSSDSNDEWRRRLYYNDYIGGKKEASKSVEESPSAKVKKAERHPTKEGWFGHREKGPIISITANLEKWKMLRSSICVWFTKKKKHLWLDPISAVTWRSYFPGLPNESSKSYLGNCCEVKITFFLFKWEIKSKHFYNN